MSSRLVRFPHYSVHQGRRSGTPPTPPSGESLPPLWDAAETSGNPAEACRPPPALLSAHVRRRSRSAAGPASPHSDVHVAAGPPNFGTPDRSSPSGRVARNESLRFLHSYMTRPGTQTTSSPPPL